ncbi:MAG: hypothetical protein HDR00_09640 [Lachnospiraceae bacterium]|nr:hypothetical protein [Lachnospiraceae bacterium]
MDYRNSDFVDEKAFEQYLRDMGVTEEQLEQDLEDHLTLDGQFYAREYQVFTKNEESICVYAADADIEDGGVSIIDWLDNMSVEELMEFWEDKEERNKIKGLMRYPGRYHEWLMLAAIPILKAMEIPMGKILEYRTLTAECNFFINDTECWHGGEGSTTMHNDLFMEIGNAYLDCAKRRVHHPFYVLQSYLQRFAEKYYRDRTESMPDALKALTGM